MEFFGTKTREKTPAGVILEPWARLSRSTHLNGWLEPWNRKDLAEKMDGGFGWMINDYIVKCKKYFRNVKMWWKSSNIETSIKTWLFRVPGFYKYAIGITSDSFDCGLSSHTVAINLPSGKSIRRFEGLVAMPSATFTITSKARSDISIANRKASLPSKAKQIRSTKSIFSSLPLSPAVPWSCKTRLRKKVGES